MLLINQPYHLVLPSSIPYSTGIVVFNFALSLVSWFHGYSYNGFLISISLTLVLFCVIIWLRELLLEADFGYHTDAVKNGLMLGIWLMIISEGTFFMGLIWSCLHTGLTPTISIQLSWPPVGIEPITWYQRSLVMTFILASSFCTANLCTYGLIINNRLLVASCLIVTILMGTLFLIGQYIEYTTAPFTMSDSIFGNTFFISTGYHGLHVLIAVLFLLVCLFHINKIRVNNYLSLNIAIIIYHIVDIVWLVIFGLLYVAVL